ncbi:MAG: hypothetical protein AAF724_22770, partial [Pseudomonadota bacterium]
MAELSSVASQTASNPDFTLPAHLLLEMQRLFQAGHSLIPLGKRDDDGNVEDNGKAASVRFQGRNRLPLKRVVEIMCDLRTCMYGVRLDGMAVVDIDDPSATGYAAERFPPSPVCTRTARGEHRFYQADFIPAENGLSAIPIDLKAGTNSYVVGPWSIRPDGLEYIPDGEPLGAVQDLPQFHDLGKSVQPAELRTSEGKIAKGSRTVSGWRIARSFAETVQSPNELFQETRAQVD